MLGFESHSRYPSVTRIHAQLQGGDSVIYHADASAGERTAIALHVASDLMRYLKRPTAARLSRLTLFNYFETCIVSKTTNEPKPTSAPAGQWLGQYGKTVTVKTTEHVRRIHFKSPAVGDPSYLRLLLHKFPARSFTELRTVHPDNGPCTVYPTFHDAARAPGLVTGDEEYIICMPGAILFQTANLLRSLLVTLILHGGPAAKLWHEIQDDIIREFPHVYGQSTGSCSSLARD